MKESNSVSYYKIGIYENKSKRYKQAIKAFDKAIELDIGFKEAYYNRGLTKAELNQYEEAIIDFNKVIELDSEFAKRFNIDNKIKELKDVIYYLDIDLSIDEKGNTVKQMQEKYSNVCNELNKQEQSIPHKHLSQDDINKLLEEIK